MSIAWYIRRSSTSLLTVQDSNMQLFAFIKGTDLNISNGSVTGFKGGKGWEQLYRPEIHDNRDCNALESTLHSPYYDISTSITNTNGMQAVKPAIEFRTSRMQIFIFCVFNATTSTENIVNGKYIYGAGVDGGSWAPSVSGNTVTVPSRCGLQYGWILHNNSEDDPGGKFGLRY